MPNYMQYYPNNAYYMQNLQNQRDFLDTQIKQLQQQNQQLAQPTNLTQNFQLAPQQVQSEIESFYAENIEDVKNRFVSKTGIFVNKDYSTIWIKDVSGNIRTFRTDEIIELDDKDKEILMLRKELSDMREVINNANTNTNRQGNSNVNESNESKKSTRVSVHKSTNAK